MTCICCIVSFSDLQWTSLLLTCPLPEKYVALVTQAITNRLLPFVLALPRL